MALGTGFFGLGAFFFVFALIFLAAFFAVYLIPTFQAYKTGRSGWWVYLICVFVGPLGLAALIAWFAYFKDKPTRLGNSDIVI